MPLDSNIPLDLGPAVLLCCSFTFLFYHCFILSSAVTPVGNCQHRQQVLSWLLVACWSPVGGSRTPGVQGGGLEKFLRGEIFDSVQLSEPLGIARFNPNSPRTPSSTIIPISSIPLSSSSFLSIFPYPSFPPYPALTAANFTLLQK